MWEVIEKSEQVVGGTHPDTLAAKLNYADTLHWLKEAKEAEKMYKEVVGKSDEALGIGHLISLRARLNWAANLAA